MVLFSKFCFRSSSIFIGPFFTEFHLRGFLRIPLKLLSLRFSKPFWGVLGPITLGIAVDIADSKGFVLTFVITDIVRRDLS